MCGHPQEQLLQAWVGILQQQEEQDGVLRPSSLAKQRRKAEALWSTCAAATLISWRTSSWDYYSR
jgi:hypothetical protein